jgi:hypothetical protein
MTLAERLSEYVRACFTGIWVQSFEHDDAIVEIARLCRQQRWSLATWDIDRGLSIAGQNDDSSTTVSARPACRDQGSRSTDHAGRYTAARATQFPSFPGQSRGRPGTRYGDFSG